MSILVVDGALPAALLDDLVGEHQHRVRYRQSERLCGLQVDDQLEARRLYDRQIGGGGPLQDASGVIAGEPTGLAAAHAVAHQPAGSDEFAPLVTGGDMVAGGECEELVGELLERLGPTVKKTLH